MNRIALTNVSRAYCSFVQEQIADLRLLGRFYFDYDTTTIYFDKLADALRVSEWMKSDRIKHKLCLELSVQF